ncbi:MAG: hypothetical protein ACJ8ES_01855, partial [Xanthobacteraceae bacterium]
MSIGDQKAEGSAPGFITVADRDLRTPVTQIIRHLTGFLETAAMQLKFASAHKCPRCERGDQQRRPTGDGDRHRDGVIDRGADMRARRAETPNSGMSYCIICPI